MKIIIHILVNSIFQNHKQLLTLNILFTFSMLCIDGNQFNYS